MELCPAGIAAIGKLLDQNISGQKICWIDPHFKVGDLGEKWSEVPSNTTVALFIRFLNDCATFNFSNRPTKFTLENLNPQDTCVLKHIVEPLQWVTDHLKTKVHCHHRAATELSLSQGAWEIKTHEGPILAKNIILAIGCESKTVVGSRPESIPLETALVRC